MPVRGRHGNFALTVCIQIGGDGDAQRRRRAVPPQDAGGAVVVPNRVQLTVARPKDELVPAIAVDVASGHIPTGCLYRNLPPDLAGIHIEAGKIAVLPAKPQEPLPIARVQKSLAGGPALAGPRQAGSFRRRELRPPQQRVGRRWRRAIPWTTAEHPVTRERDPTAGNVSAFAFTIFGKIRSPHGRE